MFRRCENGVLQFSPRNGWEPAREADLPFYWTKVEQEKKVRYLSYYEIEYRPSVEEIEWINEVVSQRWGQNSKLDAIQIKKEPHNLIVEVLGYYGGFYKSYDFGTWGNRLDLFPEKLSDPQNNPLHDEAVRLFRLSQWNGATLPAVPQSSCLAGECHCSGSYGETYGMFVD